MIAGLLKFIFLFIVIYLAVRLIRFFITLYKTVSAGLENAKKAERSRNVDGRNSRPDIIELNKDQYRVD